MVALGIANGNGHAASQQRPDNRLLQLLNDQDFELFQRHVEWVGAQPDQVLYSPGDSVGTVYFPCGPSVASFRVVTEDGQEVETVLVGKEGAVGGIVSHGDVPAFTRIVVQFGGPFLRLRLADLQAIQDRSRYAAHLFARYADCLLAQIFQSSACNAAHSIEQRLAKWIIDAMERREDRDLPLTHAQLAAMVGIGRNYASRLLQVFREHGLIQTRRGGLQIVDQAGLERRACQCHNVVKRHFARVLLGVYPSATPAA
ncbi:Crp/Fnr family transcriptional regulator [Steroidobacter sp.]|uniref:Crp/Fnr family transcriptional regulator n=1 Tax=Steroidobacter sp. TaxID=1978227 RepID=UPI001A5E731E|nr:Crp/Fnr family transcriptional regulator [Steroidobacter sp.]MBL8266450.1 Crp/Fnr family transcriptional regulator [Steroidobacter sp.]